MSETLTYAEKSAQLAAAADAQRARGSRPARMLLALMIRRMDAQGPKAQAVGIARLQGACDMLAATHGWTPHAYEMAVIEPWRAACANGRPAPSPTSSDRNLTYLTWEGDLVEAIDAELAKLI